MPFSETDRVIFRKNPLVQVICQVRFPTILRINSEPPAQFQESIRKYYPKLRERGAVNVSLQIPKEIAEVIDIPIASDKKAYDFISEDDKWVISLTDNFLALTSNEYERWEIFKDRLEAILTPLKETYSLMFFSRVGLRYINLIRRSKLNLEDVKWLELLSSNILAELASPDITEIDVEECANNILIKLEDDLGRVRIQHGLAQDETNESCYLIDNDFHTDQKVEIANVYTHLNEFNKRSRRLFRWCITDKLYEAMEPQTIG